jgi:hypothetical protein
VRIPGIPAGDTLLEGWRKIAEFLGVSIDTAQRWENPCTLPKWATFPLPTRETMGHKWALASELDVWLAQQTVPGLIGGRLRSGAVRCGSEETKHGKIGCKKS